MDFAKPLLLCNSLGVLNSFGNLRVRTSANTGQRNHHKSQETCWGLLWGACASQLETGGRGGSRPPQLHFFKMPRQYNYNLICTQCSLEGTQLCALLVINLFRSEGRGDGRYLQYPSKLTGKNPSAEPGMVKGGVRLCTRPFGAQALSRLPTVTLVTVSNYLNRLGLSKLDTSQQALRG